MRTFGSYQHKPFKLGVAAKTNVAAQAVLRFVAVVLPQEQCVLVWTRAFDYVKHTSQLRKRACVARHASSFPISLSSVDVISGFG
jgi:hypothetical protein